MKKHTIYFSIKCSVPASIMQEPVPIVSERSLRQPWSSPAIRPVQMRSAYTGQCLDPIHYFLSLVPIDHEGLHGYQFYHNSKGNHFAIKCIWHTFMVRNCLFITTNNFPCKNKSKFMFLKISATGIYKRQAPAQLKHCFPFYWPTEMRVAHVQEKVPRDPYNWSEKITCVSINDLIGDLTRPQCITKPELPPQQLVVYPQSFVHIKLNIAYISSYLPTTGKARCSFARCYLQMLSDNTEGNCCAADTGIVSDVLIERISLH